MNNIETILNDEFIYNEIFDKLNNNFSLSKLKEFNISSDKVKEILSKEKSLVIPKIDPLTEAIILNFGRPALLIQNDTFEIPESDEWKNRLYPTKSFIENAIKSVGKIELRNHPNYKWVGTGWMITEDILVTNRHVAKVFAKKEGNQFIFSKNYYGHSVQANVDFKNEYQIDKYKELKIKEIIYIEEDGYDRPDIAFLRVEKSSDLPEPVILDTNDVEVGTFVAVIGYPAIDSQRNDPVIMSRIFNDIYNVKRLQPGTVVNFNSDKYFFNHDCSTLGGNSGSIVIDIESGKAIGIHFGGRYHDQNYAVKSKVLMDKLADLSIMIPSEGIEKDLGEIPKEIIDISHYDDRKGYQKDFLGNDYIVEMPFSDLFNNDGVVVDNSKESIEKYNLKYKNFSVVMSKARQLAYYTACNIDGKKLRRISRKGIRWMIDPRIPREYQCGNELYRRNDLDRGHLVRRLDVVWGDYDEAYLANKDTFHYTNASPQHKDLNQKTWLELENWLIDNADIHDLKINIFTGPVFKDNDIVYRGVKIPKDFWKIAVIKIKGENRLSATAYLLSQEKLLSTLERPFIFGEFKTYQISIRELENKTGLDLNTLREYDPIDNIETLSYMKNIEKFEDILL